MVFSAPRNRDLRMAAVRSKWESPGLREEERLVLTERWGHPIHRRRPSHSFFPETMAKASRMIPIPPLAATTSSQYHSQLTRKTGTVHDSFADSSSSDPLPLFFFSYPPSRLQVGYKLRINCLQSVTPSFFQCSIYGVLSNLTVRWNVGEVIKQQRASQTFFFLPSISLRAMLVLHVASTPPRGRQQLSKEPPAPQG